MKNWGKRIANLLIGLIILGFLINYIYRLPKYNDGEEAPDFTSIYADSSAFNLYQLDNSYVLLDFWGSWCGPCRKDNKDLVPFYHKYKDATFSGGANFEVVSVAIETRKELWQKAIQKDQLDWPHHVSTVQRFKSDAALKYGVREIPTKYLISPDHKILGVNLSYEEMSRILEAAK